MGGAAVRIEAFDISEPDYKAAMDWFDARCRERNPDAPEADGPISWKERVIGSVVAMAKRPAKGKKEKA